MTKNLTIERILLGAILIIALLLLFKGNAASLGIARDASQFDSDVYISKTLEVAGTSTLGVTALSGATTLSGATNITGAATLSGGTTILQSATTTLVVGSSDTAGTGCFAVGTGKGIAYVTVASSTITATTTKPASCR